MRISETYKPVYLHYHKAAEFVDLPKSGQPKAQTLHNGELILSHSVQCELDKQIDRSWPSICISREMLENESEIRLLRNNKKCLAADL